MTNQQGELSPMVERGGQTKYCMQVKKLNFIKVANRTTDLKVFRHAKSESDRSFVLTHFVRLFDHQLAKHPFHIIEFHTKPTVLLKTVGYSRIIAPDMYSKKLVFILNGQLQAYSPHIQRDVYCMNRMLFQVSSV